MSHSPEFLAMVDKFIHPSDELTNDGPGGELSGATVFAAGRYNAFNFVSIGGMEETRPHVDAFSLAE